MALLVPPLDDIPPPLTAAVLLVRTDRMQEYICATLTLPTGVVWQLGARAHHVVLLALARARLADRGHGSSPEREGWVHADPLAARLGVDVQHLNIMIHRIRTQLAALGFADAAAIVEHPPSATGSSPTRANAGSRRLARRPRGRALRRWSRAAPTP